LSTLQKIIYIDGTLYLLWVVIMPRIRKGGLVQLKPETKKELIGKSNFRFILSLIFFFLACYFRNELNLLIFFIVLGAYFLIKGVWFRVEKPRTKTIPFV